MPWSRFRLALPCLLLAGCAAAPEPPGPPRREQLLVLTQAHELIRINAGHPSQVLARMPLLGLPADDEIVGIDFRVARGVLYALSRRGQLFTLDPASARLAPVGGGAPLALPAGAVGFDFNPAADRIRVVAGGLSLRLHPDTGAQVDGEPSRDGLQPDTALAYDAGDRRQGQPADLVAAGYTYHPRDDKLTTNYAIDRAAGTLVMQGSREGMHPVVSPNSGRLTTVGPLGLGPIEDASLDIADVGGAALAAVRLGGRTQLYQIDLASGQARRLGRVADGGPLRGLAIEP